MTSLKESVRSAFHNEDIQRLDGWAEGYIQQLEQHMLYKYPKALVRNNDLYDEVLRFLRGETK